MITTLRHIYRYFRPLPRWRLPPPEYASDINWRKDRARYAERTLMRLGGARTPENARQLLRKYPDLTPHQIVARLPGRKRRTFRQRLTHLIRRMEGHDHVDPYSLPGWYDDRV